MDEKDKERICQKFNETYPAQYISLLEDDFFDVSEYDRVFDKIQKVNDKIIRYLRKYACFFGDLCVQHIDIMQYK